MSFARKFKRKNLAVTTALTLSAALALVGCGSGDGGGDSSALQPVSVTKEEGQELPSVSVDGEINAEETSTLLLQEGDGETVQPGELAIANSQLVDPSTGETLSESYSFGGEAIYISEDLEAQDPELYNALSTWPVGSIFAYYRPADTTTDANAQSRLLVVEIADKRPATAWGEEVDPSEIDENLPEVSFESETTAPTVTIPEGQEPSAELIVSQLRKGDEDGATITEESQVTVQYHGVSWSTGETFDSTWDRDAVPSTFQIQGLIAGWQQGLVGQQEGSRVLISVPPELGYGVTEGEDEEGDHELANETLIFVVDILHVVNPPETEETAAADEAEASTEETAEAEASATPAE